MNDKEKKEQSGKTMDASSTTVHGRTQNRTELLHLLDTYIVSKRVVLPLVPRNGESELIERDLSGVEGRVAHTGLQLRIFEAAVIAVLVRVCVLHSSSKPAGL